MRMPLLDGLGAKPGCPCRFSTNPTRTASADDARDPGVIIFPTDK